MKYNDLVEEIVKRIEEKIKLLKLESITSMRKECLFHNLNLRGIHAANSNTLHRAFDEAITELATEYREFIV